MEIKAPLLIQTYTAVGNSADKIAAFPDIRRNFLDRLAIQDDDGKAIWRLLQLRKAGKLPKDLSRRN